MNLRTGWLILALTTTLFLPACGKQQQAVPQQTQAKAKSSSTVVSIKITSYGPDTIKAGQPFNPQPDGMAAVWVRVDRSLEGSDAAIYFDGSVLKSSISGNLITAGVPANLYARSGNYTLHVAGTKGNAKLLSNDVGITAK